MIRDAEVNPQGGQTPLAVACAKANVKTAELLLEFGAKKTAKGTLPVALLNQFSKNECRKLIETLLDGGARPDITDVDMIKLLKRVAESKHWDFLQRLIDKTQFSLRDQSEERRDKAFLDALRSACRGGHPSLVAALLRLKVDTTIKDAQGYTVLMSASWLGYEEIVKMLLKSPAKTTINQTNGHHGTALGLALSQQHRATAQLLLDAGADAVKALKQKTATAEKLLKQWL